MNSTKKFALEHFRLFLNQNELLKIIFRVLFLHDLYSRQETQLKTHVTL